MQPELKHLFVASSTLPDDPQDCCVPMVATVGLPGCAAGDDFHFSVVTTRYVARNWPLRGAHTLVVDRFDLPVVERSVQALLAGRSGPTWAAIARDLHEVMAWEFHDYRE